MKNFIKNKITEIFDEIVEFRRELHMNPEIGHQEEETAKRIVRELEKLNLDEIRTGIGGHGVVGVLKGGKGEGKTILLRADIDCLPMTEKTCLPFASQKEGLMHACGHDVHTAILLGAAKVLSEMRDEFAGNILFTFQPAEEAAPEGGAQGMIDDGVLDDPKVDAAFAMHVWNDPVGKVSFRNGPMMAQSDRIFITINGKASHASQPEAGHDAIVAASHVVSALQTIVARNVSPFTPLVITIGTIKGGDRYNVICDKVVLEGTVRVFDMQLAEEMPDRINKLVKAQAESFGCTADVELVRGYAITQNDPKLFEIGYEALTEQLGAENVIIPEYPASGGEDFSAFGKKIPIFFMWLGMESEMNEGKTTLHNPHLIVDENCIPVGIESAVAFALKFLA